MNDVKKVELLQIVMPLHKATEDTEDIEENNARKKTTIQIWNRIVLRH